jgi:hypothetical protein
LTENQASKLLTEIIEVFCSKEHDPPKRQLIGWKLYLKALDHKDGEAAVTDLLLSKTETWGKLPAIETLKAFINRQGRARDYPFCPCCREGWIHGHKFVKQSLTYESLTACDCKQGQGRSRGYKDDQGKFWPGAKSYQQAVIQKCGNLFCTGKFKQDVRECKETGKQLTPREYNRENCVSFLNMQGHV